jgi:arsenical pump membrane protein
VETLWVSAGAALASNLLNNLPTVLLARSALQAADAAPHVAYAVLLGTDLGPTLLPSASLATVLVLTTARRWKEPLALRTLLPVGLWVTPPVLVAASLALALF